jgi:FlaA1/EpsC-like NDP-sugar epimerase
VSVSFHVFSQAVARRRAGFLSPARFATGEDRGPKLAGLVLRHRSWFTASFQALLILCALILAWLLRFNLFLPDRLLLFSAAPVLIAIRLGAISRFGLLHGWWRYADINDAVAIFKAIASGSVVFVFCMRFVLGSAAFPRTIYVLEPLLSMLFLGGVRVLSRILAESAREDATPGKEVILIGAGSAAQMTIREIGRPGSGYRAVACVDDDRSKTGIKIHGVPVIGTVDELRAFAAGHAIQEVLIAVPSATGKQMQRFVDTCGEAGMKFKTVPSLQDILNGRINISQFRDVRLEDLLGREPVEVDLESVRGQIEGQIVLVTGAAGSIGSELCRQILQSRPGKLICLDHNETGIFYLQLELARQESASHLVFCVTDIGDHDRVSSLLAEHKPGIIFHAAAYKHVPMMETNVYEAVKNNVFALLSLLEIAEENGCPSFVLISSDKAVNPANVMGATKRLGELIISCRPPGLMRCVSVRFGNVLGSNGSVVPLFQKQIRDHQQLTITHPDIVRFFMTTHEAVSLVLQGFAIGNHGDTLLLDMGEPVRILDLAKTLIRLSGKSEHEVGIRFTGLRDGEKLFEELSYPAEEIHPTPFPKIKQIRGTPHRADDLTRHLDQLRTSISGDGAAAIRTKMKEIVPEYCDGHDDLPEDVGILAGREARVSPQFFSPKRISGNSTRCPAMRRYCAPANEPGN